MEIFARLRGRFPLLALEAPFAFSRHTTIGTGGTCAVAASPASERSCAELVRFLQEEGIPHVFLGVGANVLPQEGRYEGVVVRFCRMRRLTARGTRVYAGAGVTGGALLSFCEQRGIGGFSAFSGIPMSVGGGVAMNAGVRERHFSDVVRAVLTVQGGKMRILHAEECRFSEKSSAFLQGLPVLGAFLEGVACSPREIARESCYFRTRRRVLPKGRSMGCVFVNPKGASAGALIEQCGLKGRCCGGAVVSDVHANFILNEGGTSEDVSRLIRLVKEEVFRRTGILLREEIRRIP